MQKTNTEPSRRGLVKILVPATTLLLLSALAMPAAAQRGGSRGGSGHHGQVGGHSGHRGGHSSYGGHRYGRHDARGHHGYRNHGYRGHQGYRGSHGYRGHQGYRGHRSYRGHTGYRGYLGFRGTFGYGGHSSYRGAYGYAGSYGRYAPYSSYVYYRHPGSYGYSYRGYPGASIVYEAPPTYVVAGKTYAAPAYASEIAIPETMVLKEGSVATSGEPTSTAEPYDARAQPARVKLSIEPGDASVYLDGRFLGLASELPEELWIDAGAHRLEVVRPGFTGQELDLELDAGEALDVDARLEAQTRVPDLHH